MCNIISDPSEGYLPMGSVINEPIHEETGLTPNAELSRDESQDAYNFVAGQEEANYMHPRSLRPVSAEDIAGTGEAEIESVSDTESEVHYKQVTLVCPVVDV